MNPTDPRTPAANGGAAPAGGSDPGTGDGSWRPNRATLPDYSSHDGASTASARSRVNGTASTATAAGAGNPAVSNSTLSRPLIAPRAGEGGGPGRLAAAGRRTRRQGVLLAAVLILAGAGGALSLSRAADTGTDIVVLARAVPRGQVVTAADLAVVRISARGGQIRVASPASATAAVVGKAALIDLGPGTPVSAQLVAASSPTPGRVTLGVRVPSDGLPDVQVRPGQQVAVVRTNTADTNDGDAQVLVERADVLSVRAPSSSSADGDSVVYLSVPTGNASAVAGAAATRGGVRLLGVSP